jgi:hypothetical protein
MNIEFIEEPLLQFGYEQSLDYPRDGLFLFGPVQDGPRVDVVRYGVIGTTGGVNHFRKWAKRIQGFIEAPVGSQGVSAYNVPFPGFEQAFRAKWPREPHCTLATISSAKLSNVLRIANRH